MEDVESEAGAEGGGRNALAGETSRYLVDSALDAVNWQPWGETAFRLARSSNKPILLSSGFLSCHMCAVMSKHFNLPHISSVLNAKFVCIKVVRFLVFFYLLIWHRPFIPRSWDHGQCADL